RRNSFEATRLRQNLSPRQRILQPMPQRSFARARDRERAPPAFRVPLPVHRPQKLNEDDVGHAVCVREARPVADLEPVRVEPEARRSGTVPETVTAFEPAARETATLTRPRRPTVRASVTGRSRSTGGSIETPAGRPARGPGWIETSTTLSL